MKSSHLNILGGILIILGLITSVGMNSIPLKAAFGTSPPWVKNDHMLPGTTFEQVINLSRSDTGNDMQIGTRLEGEKELLKWIKIENEQPMIMKAGQKTYAMKVSVKAPKRAAIKNYRAGIFVTLEPTEESRAKGGTVAIKLGAHILVDITVIGDKVINYRVKSISLDAITEDQPFYMNVEMENMGNTEITELTGTVDIYNKTETEVLKSLNFGALEEPSLPDIVYRTKVIFKDIFLPSGDYWTKIKVFKGKEVIYENRLYQKVDPKLAPVVMPADASVKKPSMPKLPSAPEAPDEEELKDASLESPVAAPPENLKPAAPLEYPQSQNNTLFLIFGLAGLAFGLVSFIVVIILLLVFIRGQRRVAIQQYLSQHPPHS